MIYYLKNGIKMEKRRKRAEKKERAKTTIRHYRTEESG
jgi:hypothetical protein